MADRKPVFALMTPYGTENNGVRMLAAVLKERGYETHTVFFKSWRNNDVIAPTRLEVEQLCGHLKAVGPDVVGIGFGTPYLRLVAQVSRAIREATGAKIVAGGIHPTFASGDCVGWADGTAIGEGEPIIADIAERTKAGESWDGIPGLRLPHHETAPAAPDFVDLNTLPHRDFSHDNKVLIEGGKIIPGDPLLRQGQIRVHASRGCPYACSYCYEASLENVYGKRFRFRRRSVDSVLEEVKAARRTFGRFKRVKFDDDTFIFPMRWMEEFCERWPQEVGLPFDILLNPEAYKRDHIEMLVAAGLKHVQMGVEAASAEEAEMYDRKDSAAVVKEFGELAARHNLEVNYDVILDNPMASTKDRRAMVDLLTELPRPYRVFLYSLNAFPESGVFDSLRDQGHMTERELEGRAQKTFRQFRASFDWPRPAEDRAHIALCALASKPFIPASFVRAASRSHLLTRHPGLLTGLARFTDVIRLYSIGLEKLIKGELTWVKIREYGGFSFRRVLTQ